MRGELTEPESGAPSGLSARIEGSVWSSHLNGPDLIFVVLISFTVITAVLLRWSGLDSQSLWEDEGYTLWISRFSPKDLWHILPTDTSAPLYYILLHYWSSRFGTSAFSLRALSALFATLSIPLFYFLARKILHDKTSVVLAMMLYAVSFFQLWYAKEARCYALLAFLSLGSVYFLLLWLENRNTLRLCGLVLLLSASLYTHNMAFFYLPGIAAIWLVYPAQQTIRARIRDALLVLSVVLLLYILWLPTLLQQLQAVHRSFWVAVPRARDLLDTLCVLGGFDAPTLQAIFRDRFHIQTLRLFGHWTWEPLVLILFIICVLGGLCAVRSADRRKVAALLGYSVIPVFLVFVDSHISTSVYMNRVFIGSCVLLPMLFCAPIAFQVGKRKKLFQLIGLFLLVGTAASAFGYLQRERRADWRGLTEYLVKLSEKQRLALIVPASCQVLVQYYASELFKSYPPIEVTGFPRTDVLAPLSNAMVSGRYKEIDIAMPSGASPELVKPTLDYLSGHCASVEIVEFHRLEVRRCIVQSTLRIKPEPLSVHPSWLPARPAIAGILR